MKNTNLYDSYLINLQKDAGRIINSKYIIEKFNTTIFKGEDAVKLDNNNKVISWPTQIEGTQHAKLAKIKLFEHFLKNSKKEYLLMFEDDIYLHKDLYNNTIFDKFNKDLNNFLKTKPVSILYLGISSQINPKKNYIKEFFFESFSEHFTNKQCRPCTGAFSVIINRKIIRLLLSRMKDRVLKKKPFDLYCLGWYSKLYPKNTFIMHPPLVLPDISQSNIRDSYYNPNNFWGKILLNYSNYKKTTIGNLCIFIKKDHRENDFLFSFNKYLLGIRPIINIIYYCEDNKELNLNFSIILKECTYNDFISEEFEKNNKLHQLDNDFKIIKETTSIIKNLDYNCGKEIIEKFY